MPVHLYGQLCDMEAMRQMLDRHPLRAGPILLIEDAAHCFEGEFQGHKPGRFGDVAIFSFYATKNVTCGEGGAIIARDDALFARILEARLHGMSAIAVDRFSAGRYNHWDMNRLGTKANLPDVLAALLPLQIETIDQRLPERHRLCARYRAAFADGPLRLVTQLQSTRSAEHIFVIGVPNGARDRAIAALNANGVNVTVNFRSVTHTTYYRKRYPAAAARCPESEIWGEQTITLPMFPGLTEAEQDHVIRVVRDEVYPLVTKT
jgi:UDP-4-amino-4-deoxy-L-arabinose-oxoglutarate aminotransferase